MNSCAVMLAEVHREARVNGEIDQIQIQADVGGIHIHSMHVSESLCH